MEYKRFNDTILLRLDPKDEIITSIKELAKKEDIKLAIVSGLGATNKFTIGRFNLETNVFDKYDFNGSYEISSLTGNITTFNNEPYLHLHIVCGSENGNTISGHLSQAYISVTSEIFIRIIDGEVDRIKKEGSYINTISF